MRCPAGGNDLSDYAISDPAIGIYYSDFNALNDFNRHPSLLTVILAIVPALPRGSIEDHLRIREVDAVIPNVRAILGGIPLEAHELKIRAVDTECQYRCGVQANYSINRPARS